MAYGGSKHRAVGDIVARMYCSDDAEVQLPRGRGGGSYNTGTTAAGPASSGLGLRVRLAAKGVTNMRLCSVMHAAWRSHKRVGSLPATGMRRVQASPFGAGVCYIAVTTERVTLQRQQ